MKQIFAGLGKITLSVFTVLVIGLMALMTYETLGRIYPDDAMKQIWGMVLFSGGTVAWFLIFLFASRSAQRPLALLMFILSLVGEVIYAAADVFMGGQTWVAIDPRFAEYVLWTFIFMTFAHGGALYVHFIIDPDKIAGIEMETMQDKAQNEALKKAQAMVAHHLDEMADTLARRTMVDVMTGLSLPLPAQVVDGKVLNMDTSAPPVLSQVAQPAQSAGKKELPFWGGWNLFGGADQAQAVDLEPAAAQSTAQSAPPARRPALVLIGNKNRAGRGHLMVRDAEGNLTHSGQWYEMTGVEFEKMVGEMTRVDGDHAEWSEGIPDDDEWLTALKGYYRILRNDESGNASVIQDFTPCNAKEFRQIRAQRKNAQSDSDYYIFSESNVDVPNAVSP